MIEGVGESTGLCVNAENKPSKFSHTIVGGLI